MLQHIKKIIVLSVIASIGLLGIYSFNTIQPQPKKLQNIKVLPSTWTYQQVDHEMDEYKEELGVKCNYCHAQSKDNPRQRDLASDANPMKNVAREMIKMTDELNKKYISVLPHSDTVKIQTVTCNTCHRGQAKPTFTK